MFVYWPRPSYQGKCHRGLAVCTVHGGPGMCLHSGAHVCEVAAPSNSEYQNYDNVGEFMNGSFNFANLFFHCLED